MRTDPFRFGTARKRSNHNAILRWAIRRKMPDDAIRAIMSGVATRVQIYGKHPTKVRAA
jgi:hypothetical protein